MVALDLPTSWMMVKSDDEMTTRMLEAMNTMMLDMLAAIARKDYTDRMRRQKQGIEKAKATGYYKGRKENVARNTAIMEMLSKSVSWNAIVQQTGCSRSTLSRLSAKMKSLIEAYS